MQIALKQCFFVLKNLKNRGCISLLLTSRRLLSKSNIEYSFNPVFSPMISRIFNINFACVSHQHECKRSFAKKRSKKPVEEEESEDEEEEEADNTFDDGSENVIKKSVSSLRLDTVLKSGLGMTKKKVEKNFYANKFRINNERITKKAYIISIGDEIDYVRGFSPENQNFLLVDKLIIKSIGKMTGTMMYPLKMEIFKGLTIENYEDPWKPSNESELI